MWYASCRPCTSRYVGVVSVWDLWYARGVGGTSGDLGPRLVHKLQGEGDKGAALAACFVLFSFLRQG